MKKVTFGKELVLSPFKMISLNEENVFLFIIEPTRLKPFCEKVLIRHHYDHYGYIDMDTFFLKVQNLGLKVFRPEDVDELISKVSFNKVRPLKRKKITMGTVGGVIIPIDIPYQHEIREGERYAGDEFDGPFDYDYYERKFPVVNSKGEVRQISFPKDGCYFDQDYPNRIAENQRYLFYSVFE